MNRIESKIAIVTGAGSGLGRATAKLFCSEGATVVAADIDLASAQETVDAIVADGGSAMAARTDVGKSADCQAMVAATIEAYGRVDILVANAGIMTYGDVVALSEDAWDRMLDINLKGIYMCCKYAIPHMQSQGGGSIVCTSSISGLIAQGNQAGYNASKFGVIGLSKCMALDFASDNIRVNAVCPGMMDTAMIAHMTEAEWIESSSKNMVGRACDPIEVARAILHLASDEASYTTGAVFVVDGGETAM